MYVYALNIYIYIYPNYIPFSDISDVTTLRSFPGVSMDGQLLGALIYACQVCSVFHVISLLIVQLFGETGESRINSPIYRSFFLGGGGAYPVFHCECLLSILRKD